LEETAWNKLGAYLKETQILGSIQSTLYWDQNTTMPKEGSNWRAEQLTYIAKKLHKRNSSQEFGDLINSAEVELSTLKDDKKEIKVQNINLLNKEYTRQKKIDPLLVEKLARAKSKGYQNWQQAKLDNDYEIFQPFLKELINLRKEEANQLAEDLSPWETLAQPYEPDLTKSFLNKTFTALKETIPPLLKNVKKRKKEVWDIDPNAQKVLCSMLLDEFGRKKELLSVAESPHPFSITLGPRDFRITTRIVKGEPFSSFLATAHEWGHSIYEQGLPSQTHQWFAWPLGQATSMAVHESQSLFWENRITKSKSFAKSFFKRFSNQGCPHKSYKELWKEMNIFKAGLNRVEADELSYGLHILIRTELEIEMIEGNLDTRDLSYEWNNRYKNLLGVKPLKDSEGCLQDVHWSEGAFGYFPSYLLGHLISAQISTKLENDIGSIEDLIENRSYEKIIFWLNNNVHKYGRTLNSMELVLKVTNLELSSEAFIKYMKNKIRDLD